MPFTSRPDAGLVPSEPGRPVEGRAVNPEVPLVIVIGLQSCGVFPVVQAVDRHAEVHADAFQEVAGNREEPGFDGHLNRPAPREAGPEGWRSCRAPRRSG